MRLLISSILGHIVRNLFFLVQVLLKVLQSFRQLGVNQDFVTNQLFHLLDVFVDVVVYNAFTLYH
jgi:hypothetical protein